MRRRWRTPRSSHLSWRVTTSVSTKAAASPRRRRRYLWAARKRSEEHTSELQSRGHLVCRLLLEITALPLTSPLFPYTTLFRSRKVAALSEFFGVRTAWHGPGDASPVAHAAQLALELASYNFGVHEGSGFPKETQEVFVGCPE